jgi:hypothetical protein
MQGWAFEGPDESGNGGISSGAFVTGPSGGTGTGSAHFVLGNQAGGEYLATTQYAGAALSSFTTLSFDTYTVSTGKSVAFQFDIDFDPSAACSTLTASATCYQGRFVFVPAFNNGAQTVATNTWQHWDTLDPNVKDWYASRGVPELRLQDD